MKEGIHLFCSKHWDALIASLAGSLFLFYFTRHNGIGISPDSVMYETVAFNIRHHFSFTDFNGLPLVDFPIGYPSFLALVMFITGSSVLQTAPLLNGILFIGVILLTSVIIREHREPSSIYKVLFLSAIACSPCLLEVYSMLWSETLFIFLVLLFILSALRYSRSHKTSHLFIMAVVAALALVTRYAGVVLVATGCFMLLFDGERSLRIKIKRVVLFTVISISLLLINLMRNSMAAHNLTGVREKAMRSAVENIREITVTFSDWFPFIKTHETLAVILFLLICIRAIYILCYRLLQQQYFRSVETIVACLFIVYTIFIISVASISRFEALSSRLLSPMYIPFLLVSSNWIVPFLRKLTGSKKIILLGASLFFYSGFLYHQFRLNAEAWEGIQDAGIPGYTEDSWTQSPTIAFMKKNKSIFSDALYSNANDAVYFLTGLHARPLPHKEIKQEIEAFLQLPSFYVIWFTDGDNPDLVSFSFINQHKKFISTREFADGKIYFFSDSIPHLH